MNLVIYWCLYREKNHNSDSKYQFYLLQAKRVKSIDKRRIPKKESSQLFLYTNWPKFSMGSKRKGTYCEYDLYPKYENPWSKYLLIHKSTNDIKTLWIARPQIELSSYQSFARDLIDLTQFQTGRDVYSSTTCFNNKMRNLVLDLLCPQAFKTANIKNDEDVIRSLNSIFDKKDFRSSIISYLYIDATVKHK